MGESGSSKVILRKENSVAWITLNRPEVLNACDIETLKALQKTLKEVAGDQSVRCVVLSGAGRAFCAGADLQSLRARSRGKELSFSEDLRDGFNPVILLLRNMEKPVIGMINGVAAGAGLGLALACDLRIMSEDAKFVEAFARVGLVPDSGATFFMPRVFGLARAFELAFTGGSMDAKEAEKLGAVNRVVKKDELENSTRILAEELASGPRGAGLSKRAINRALWLDIEGALDYEAYLQEVAGSTEDHREGVNAFLEKRPSKFQGK